MSSTLEAPHGAPASEVAEVPALPPDATADEREAHWYKYVYQGDRMPQLTLRAVLMGGVLGMMMSVANLYTTLKIGWSFGVAITACVMSYVIWNAFRAISGNRLTQMSILENNCMQSTASAAGYSTGATIATAFGALLIINNAHMDWKIVLPFTFLTGAMGVFLAIPMKRQMINQEQLPFPSGVLAAETLRSLYSRGREALHKAYALITAMVGGAVVGFFNTPATDGLLKWFDRIVSRFSLPSHLPAAGFGTANGVNLSGFFWEPSVLLIAAGMIVGLRVSLSMLGGALLLYLVVGPWVLPQLQAFDAAGAAPVKYVVNNTFAITRWSLWAGTSIMVFSSLTAVALQWKTIVRSFSVLRGVRSAGPAAGADIEVPLSWFIVGMLPISIALIALQWIAFEINVLLGIVSVVMSLILALVACRATGETDTTPVGAMGKVMQLLFAVLSPKSISHNLISAGVAANGASSSADLLTDLKSGYLLGANPRRQFLAQFFGVFFGVVAIVPAWYLMVPTKEAIEKFNPPATYMWLAVAQALTQGLDQIPISARYGILYGALLGIALPVVSTLFPRAAKFMPSAMGLGLSWVVIFSNSLSFAIGAVIAGLWSLAHKRMADIFVAPIAAGCVAGESLMKAVLAMSATAVGLYQSKTGAGGGS